QRLGEPLDDSSMYLVLSAHWIDDLATYISDSPDLVDRNIGARNTRLDYLGKIAAVGEVESEPLRPAGLRRLFHPVRYVHDLVDPVARATSVERWPLIR